MKILKLFEICFQCENMSVNPCIYIGAKNEEKAEKRFWKIIYNHPILSEKRIKIKEIKKMRIGYFESEDVYI